jgi:hypothetical protein
VISPGSGKLETHFAPQVTDGPSEDVFYLFIIPVTLNHADISSTCRNECKVRSVTHSACGDVEKRVDMLKGNP